MNYNRLCLMLPTYKRWNTLLPVFIESAIAQAGDIKNICFSFCVHEEDVGTQSYLEQLFHHKYVSINYEVIIESLPKPNLATYFNLLYGLSKFREDTTVVSMLGDDMEFKTKGYDLEMLNLINHYDGIGVFWANDEFIARERMCVNMFVTRKMVRATGEPFMCEKYPADMIDWIWHRVGKYSKSLHFLPDVIIKHNHNTAKPKEEWDETYNRLRPAQAEAHAVYGKSYAKEYAHMIAGRLKEKGFTGDNA